jgi:nucleoside-diphosphate-sugar epimerase
MPRVLVTGSSGLIGRPVVSLLEAGGWSVQRFDLMDGDDLRDAAAVRTAAEGCDAIVHAGAIPHDSRGTPDDIVATNVLGTWHVLSAAEHHGAGRVVVFSSGQVFGFAGGEGTPVYTPVDDDHPLRAARPYGMSKRLIEEMCEIWSSRTGIPTIVLRPVMVLDEEMLSRTTPGDLEYASFVHVDDVASAVPLALQAEVGGHARITLSGPGPFDVSRAREVLGWEPRRGWTTGG